MRHPRRRSGDSRQINAGQPRCRSPFPSPFLLLGISICSPWRPSICTVETGSRCTTGRHRTRPPDPLREPERLATLHVVQVRRVICMARQVRSHTEQDEASQATGNDAVAGLHHEMLDTFVPRLRQAGLGRQCTGRRRCCWCLDIGVGVLILGHGGQCPVSPSTAAVRVRVGGGVAGPRWSQLPTTLCLPRLGLSGPCRPGHDVFRQNASTGPFCAGSAGPSSVATRDSPRPFLDTCAAHCSPIPTSPYTVGCRPLAGT